MKSVVGSNKDIWLAIGYRDLDSTKKLGPNNKKEKQKYTQWTPLHYAVFGGDYEVVKALINCGYDIDALDSFGATPLDIAIRENHLDIAQLLAPMIQIKPSFRHCCHSHQMETARWCLEHTKGFEAIDAKDNKNGQAAIHVAAMLGNFQLVQLLIEQGCEIDLRDNQQRTALHCSVEGDCKDVIEHLVDNKADVNARDAAGATPLIIAASASTPETIGTLLKHGADVTILDNQGNNVFHAAATREVVEDNIIPELCKAVNDRCKPADQRLINQKNSEGLTPMHVSILTHDETVKKHDALITFAQDNNQPITGIAATSVSQSSVFQLFHGGADPRIGDNKDGNSAAHIAVQLDSVPTLNIIGNLDPASLAHPNSQGQYPVHLAQSVPVLRSLIDKQPAALNLADKQGETPLSLAVQRQGVELGFVQAMLNAGANPITVNDQDETPLFASMRARNPLIATHILRFVSEHSELFNNQSDMTKLSDYLDNAVSGTLKTVMHLAAELGNSNLLEDFAKHDGNVNQCDVNDNTPAHYAAVSNSASCIDVLFAREVDFNVGNANGNTPLIAASECDAAEAASALLINGADLNKRNYKNQSALMVTRGSNATHVKEAIIGYKMKLASAKISGKLTIGLSWSCFADLDLTVIEPSGERVWFPNRKTTSGGELDVDKNAGGPESVEPVEHIYWDAPPKGKYFVFVSYYCDHTGFLKDEQKAVGCENPCPFDISIELGQACVIILTGEASMNTSSLKLTVDGLPHFMNGELNTFDLDINSPTFVCCFTYDGDEVQNVYYGDKVRVDKLSESLSASQAAALISPLPEKISPCIATRATCFPGAGGTPYQK